MTGAPEQPVTTTRRRRTGALAGALAISLLVGATAGTAGTAYADETDVSSETSTNELIEPEAPATITVEERDAAFTAAAEELGHADDPAVVPEERATASASPVVKIPDVTLRAELRDYLGLGANADITQADLKSLRNIQTFARNIEGLQYATKLETLIVYNSALSSIAPIKGIKSLWGLGIFDSKLGNKALDVIRSLKNLDYLDVSSSKVTKLNFLRAHHDLTYLSVGGSKLRNLAEVGKLSKLRNLSVSGPKIVSLKPLGKLKKMRDLTIYSTKTTNLTPLGKLTSLRYLAVADTKAKSVKPLVTLKRLKELYLPENKITDPMPLVALQRRLEFADLSGNRISRNDKRALEEAMQYTEFNWSSDESMYF